MNSRRREWRTGRATLTALFGSAGTAEGLQNTEACAEYGEVNVEVRAAVKMLSGGVANQSMAPKLRMHHTICFSPPFRLSLRRAQRYCPTPQV
ncbi:hypothetical protein PENSPDRAFT_659542 [Peniophora sp. CONT]|nr:hypothetical protein PENSPDRAFT_659542 [Peniophora sp. CONT]